MAQQVLPYLKPGVPFYSVGTYDQTLDFYLGRTVTLVQFRDELDFGLQQEPQLAIPDGRANGGDLEAAALRPGLVGKDLYEQLARSRLPDGADRQRPSPLFHQDAMSRRRVAMNALSFALVLLGVLLNAAAQLLLKAGTNASAISSSAPPTWCRSAGRWRPSPISWAA